jgi:hypothetical protein
VARPGTRGPSCGAGAQDALTDWTTTLRGLLLYDLAFRGHTGPAISRDLDDVMLPAVPRRSGRNGASRSHPV